MADSTLLADPELQALRAEAQGYVREYTPLTIRHQDTWSDGATRQFSVQDPNRTEGNLARSLRTRPDAAESPSGASRGPTAVLG